MPRLPLAGSVVANSDHHVGDRPLVIKFFVPFITQRSPSAVSSSWARVRCAFASEPASGSDSAKQPIFRPAARSGSQRARWASVASCRMGAQDQRVLHRHRDRRRRAGARDLLQRHRVRKRVHAAAAPLLGHHDAEQPELAEACEDLLRELVLAVDLGGPGQDLAAPPDHARCPGSASAPVTGRSSCAFPGRGALLRRTPACPLFDPRLRTAPRTVRARLPARRRTTRRARAARRARSSASPPRSPAARVPRSAPRAPARAASARPAPSPRCTGRCAAPRRRRWTRPIKSAPARAPRRPAARAAGCRRIPG